MAKKKPIKKKKMEPSTLPPHETASDHLTPKRELFCQEYVVDLNAKRAYKDVYQCADAVAETNGPRLLRIAQVEERVNQLLQQRIERTKITADYVLTTIVDTVERCRQVRPVLNQFGQQVMIETPEGKVAPAYTFNAKDALKGLELLGKHQKLFTDKKEISGSLKLEDLLDASLEEDED